MSGRIASLGLVTMVLVVVAATAPAAGAHEFFPQSVASGDPRPDSVVLWTRVDSPTEEEPKLLDVVVATDAEFAEVVANRQISAWAENDYCTKVKVDGLDPYTTYYYRFDYGGELSPVGRTRTAPAHDADQEVRFAVVYCQDYIGRYFNTYAELLNQYDQEIDFVVHLGDYVYETTGDPSFQDPDAERRMVFADVEGAIPLGDDGAEYYGAASLANYRTLYRTYRSDPELQAVHERWPMIVIWDDHEFSNDSWQATATYTGGRDDENQPDRKRNAEQAFFEWIPIEAGIGGDGVLAVDASMLYPNTMIYRDFQFGAHLQMILTDYRTYRPDHLIPENAFPGEIILDQQALVDLLGNDGFEAVRGSLDPYLNMTALGTAMPIFHHTLSLIVATAHMMENPALDTFAAIDLAESQLQGNVSMTYLMALFDAAGYSTDLLQMLAQAMPRGLSYLYLGKQDLYGSVGSRYLVMHDTYDLAAAASYLATGGASQNAFGDQQDAWLQGALLGSQATWKVLASSVSMAPMTIDFTNPGIAAMLPDGFPDALRARLKLNVDQWDGFPQKRMELLGTPLTAGLLAAVPNSVVISGDIHATFISDHGYGVYEFTPPAVSSATLGNMVASIVASTPMLSQVEGIDQLIPALPLLLSASALDDVNVSPSDILYSTTDQHGFLVVTVGADALDAELFEIPNTEVGTSYYDDPVALHDLFNVTDFRIENGSLTMNP